VAWFFPCGSFGVAPALLEALKAETDWLPLGNSWLDGAAVELADGDDVISEAESNSSSSNTGAGMKKSTIASLRITAAATPGS
jgi:hypothetical protein